MTLRAGQARGGLRPSLILVANSGDAGRNTDSCPDLHAQEWFETESVTSLSIRIDWKYALGLSLIDPGFDHTVLSEFRSRLIEGGAERLLLDTLLQCLPDHGLVRAKGHQRTSSTSACPIMVW